MNIGVIGAGDHAERSHLRFLADAEEHRVAAMADLDRAKMDAVSQRLNLDAHHTTDWEEVLGDSTIDAVFIMTPDRLHATQLAAAVAVGKHVFCEKPLADTPVTYNKISQALDEARDKGLVVSSCHPRRFDPPFVQTKEFLDDRALLGDAFGLAGDLGDVIGFNFAFRYHAPSKVGLHQSLMFDHLNHEVDLANYFFGVSGLSRAIALHDSALRYEVSAVRDDGIGLAFRGGRFLESRIYQEDMRIDFERGMLAMDMHEGTALLQYEDKAAFGRSLLYKTDYDVRFAGVNDHFLLAAEGLEPPYLTAEELRLNTLAAVALRGSSEAVTVRP